MRQLVLVRHGESLWNAEGRVQGQSCAGLSEIGHAQAAAFAAGYADGLAERRRGGGAVRIVSSDLQRATETAQPLAERLDLEVVLDASLRERAFGTWEGRTHRALAVEESALWERWTRGEDVMTQIGAETASELAGRVAPTLGALLADTPSGGVTVVVSHGGSIWHGLHRLLELQPRSLGPVGNGAVAELLLLSDDSEVARGSSPRPVLASFNDLTHLPAHLRSGGFAGTTSDAVPQMR